jgi:hypothetical protein
MRSNRRIPYSGNTKDLVERVSLDTGLRRLSSSGSGLGSSAEVPSSLVGTASVDQLVADGTGDDVDVLSGALGERSYDK